MHLHGEDTIVSERFSISGRIADNKDIVTDILFHVKACN